MSSAALIVATRDPDPDLATVVQISRLHVVQTWQGARWWAKHSMRRKRRHAVREAAYAILFAVFNARSRVASECSVLALRIAR